MEFLEPCMWETITNLQDVCGNTFEAVAPLSSANIAWDALADTIDWSCPTHAFCNQCADDTEPGGINRYCVALMLKTSSLYPHLDLFDHLEALVLARGAAGHRGRVLLRRSDDSVEPAAGF